MKSLLAIGTSLLGLAATPVLGEVFTLWGESGGKLEKRILKDMSPKPELVPRLETRQTCVHSATSRNCWLPGFDINTDHYKFTPNTGQTKIYDLSITNTTCNPDGNGARVCMLINNQYPGPTITANWGDTLRITVRNKLQHNGTSMHWHGIRQVNSNIQDGANGITECALAPGDSKTYQFRATEYGTSWYHSHFSGQYGDGVVGTIVINGPASANYDIDLGVQPLSDWYYITAFQAGIRAATGGGPPPQGNNILVNGKNKNANGGGTYDVKTLTPGKKHRLRIINTSIDTQLRVSLDGHSFQVISNDFVPVTPYTTNWLVLGIGQRYDVIINANQAVGNYWFRAEAEGLCQSSNAGVGRSIFRYTGAAAVNPTTNALTGTPTSCIDPVTTPVVALNVPSAQFSQQAQSLPVAFGPVTVNGQNLVLWTVKGSTMIIDWTKPTLQYVKDNTPLPPLYNVVNVPQANQWTYWIIQQAAGAPPIAHPIHLHGHDMYILGTGSGTFSSANIGSLRFTNPTRRDVAMLPASGWLVIAYPTDNPGAWLMHCHIAFHVSMGLSVQFLERKSEIAIPAAGSEWFNTCQNMKNYMNNQPKYPQDDSGLKKRWPPLVEME